MGKKKSGEYLSGHEETAMQSSLRRSRRYGKVLFKLILFTCINIILAVVGLKIAEIYAGLTINISSDVTKMVEPIIEGTKNEEIAKYCYLCLALWIYVIVDEIFVVFRTLMKLFCITFKKCLVCDDYLNCRYKDIKVMRNY